MKKCTTCGREVPDDFKFCTNCGGDYFEPVTETTVEAAVEAVTQTTEEAVVEPVAQPISDAVTVATPITPPETPAPVVNIPGDARSFTMRDRIRKLAASKLSATLEILTGLQFVILLIAGALYSYSVWDTSAFLTVLISSIVTVLPYFLIFLEASISHSSAKNIKRKKMSSVGVFFGTVGNIIITIYAGIFVILYAIIAFATDKILYALDVYRLPANILGYGQYFDAIEAALKSNIIFIPVAVSIVWFIAYILLDVAHTRTIGAIKCVSIQKTPFLLPTIALFLSGLAIVAMVVLPMVSTQNFEISIPVQSEASAIAIVILLVAVCALWALTFFVQAILNIRLRLCFKK